MPVITGATACKASGCPMRVMAVISIPYPALRSCPGEPCPVCTVLALVRA
ncbi:Uncharacterised protein [Mycobacteroides abscessus subsp. abscessus]|nr:Uncharacterised protein [Mycobacteroides abscessus subsp. abscessus]